MVSIFKEMDKVTTDDPFDYWQVSVSVGHASNPQYLFELEDSGREDLVRGPRCSSFTKRENLDLSHERF